MANEFVARNGLIALDNSSITGSLNVSSGITGSLFGTASWSENAVSASYFSGSVSSAVTATSASYAATASIAIVAITASYFSGSISSAITAETASYVNPLRQRVIISGAIDLYPTQDPDPTGAITTDTFLFVSASNTSLGNDLYFRQDGNLTKFKWIEGSLASGLLYGGILSYSGSYLYIKSGSGLIFDANATTGSEPNPIVTQVRWNDITQSLTYLTSSTQTYVYINSSGVAQQQTTFFTPDQYNYSIPLGLIYHSNKTTATAVGYNVYTTYNTTNQALDFVNAFGPLKENGLTLTGQTGTLRLNVSSGTAYILGGFYAEDPESVSHKNATGAVTASIVRYYRTGSAFIADNNSNNFYTVIDPSKYDDGTGTLPSVPGGSYTIQRAFYNPRTNRVAVYYGQSTYGTLANALSQVGSDPFNEAELTAHNNVFVGYLVVKSNTTDLTNTSDNAIIQSGLFRNTVGSAGSTSFTPSLDSLTDVTITSPTNGQALIYSSGDWINGVPYSALTASYATNFYVSGAITTSLITNPSGDIVLTPMSASINTGSVELQGGLKWKRTSTAVATEVGDLITFGGTMGLIEGGGLTTASIGGLVAQAGEAVMYTMTTFPYSSHNLIKYNTVGSTDASRQITLPASSSVYVYYNNSGVLTYNITAPSSRSNVILGKVTTDATNIIYIDASQINAHHYSNYVDRMLREALGPIFSTGGITTQGTTSGSLNVTAATYFFSQNRITTNGASPITMDNFYRSGSTYVRTTGSALVSTSSYDDGSGTLASIPSGKFVKHSLYLLGDNSLQATATEAYLMVYGQSLYDTVGDAEAGSLPTPPSFFTDSIAIIASLVVTPDSQSIQTILDERPRLSFISPSKTGVITAHGDLTGLTNDDHPQYLLVDGTRQMSGNLGLGGNTLYNFNLVSGSAITASGAVITDINATTVTATSFTGSLLGNASSATTASYVLNSISASFASTASYINPLRQDVIITGSLYVSSSNVVQFLVDTGSLVVKNDGAVGLGVTNPYLSAFGVTTLHIGSRTVGSTGNIRMTNSTSTNVWVLYADNNGSYIQSTTPLAIYTGGAERMRVFSSTGNILVGSTAVDAGYKFDVAGKFRATGFVSSSGTTFDHNIIGRIGIGTLYTGAGTDGIVTINVAGDSNTSALSVINNSNATLAAISNSGSFYSIGTGGHPATGYHFGATWNPASGGTLFGRTSAGYTAIVSQNQPLVLNPWGTNYTDQPVFVGNGTPLSGYKFQVSGSSNFQNNIMVTGSVTATNFTGSLFGTASWANNVISASNASTASYVLNAVSASFATTAANANTASYVLNAISSSFATTSITSSFANNFTVAGTLTAQTIVVQTITSSTDYVTGSTIFGSSQSNTHQFTGSVRITGSLTVVGSGITGSLFGTSSWATNAVNANTATTAVSATNVAVIDTITGAGTYYPTFVSSNAGNLAIRVDSTGLTYDPTTNVLTVGSITSSLFGTSSWANNAVTASYILQAISASFASTAANANTASFVTTAQTASYVLNAISSSFASTAANANTASYVLQAVSASFASTAANANTASYVQTAQTASYVLNAVSSSFASTAANANTASYVLNAISASFASTASNISPAITNNTNDYLLTATGTGTINGESILTFDGTKLSVLYQAGDEGGEILLGKAATNTTLTGSGVTIDVWQNRLRFFEQGGTARGAFIDITSCAAGVGTNLLSGAGAGTVTQVDTAGSVNGITLTGGPITGAGTITLGGTLSNVQSSQLATSSLAIGTTNIGLGATASTLTGLTSVTSTSFTGSLFGTSSWANNATTASYVLNAVSASFASTAANANTASYVLNAVSSSFASTAANANTASYVLQAVSASFATTAANANTASFVTTAQTASYVLNAVSSSFASTAANANTASFVTTAQTASYVLQAVSASFATIAANANTASFVTTAQTASYVLNAISASYAAINIQDESSPQGSSNTINFTGAGVTATIGGGIATVNIPGGAGAAFPFTGSAIITGSLVVTGSTTSTLGFTGSLFGTASFATSASFAPFTGLRTKAGSVANTSFAGNPRKATVTFGTAFANTNYAITVTGEDARSWTIESKVAGSFVINANSNTGLTGTTYWIATAYGETT